MKLDASGRELGRVSLPTTPRATEAQMTLIDLDAADAILVVATNVGDPFEPLEADDEVFRAARVAPHARPRVGAPSRAARARSRLVERLALAHA